MAAAAARRGPLPGRPGDRGEAAHLRLHPVGDIADAPLPTLVRLFGATTGRALHSHAQGRDPRTVQPQPLAKSVSAERSFDHDVLDPVEHRRTLLALVEEVASQPSHARRRPPKPLAAVAQTCALPRTPTQKRSPGPDRFSGFAPSGKVHQNDPGSTAGLVDSLSVCFERC